MRLLIILLLPFGVFSQETPYPENELKQERAEAKIGEDEIVKFPDIEPKYPGGPLELQSYLLENFKMIDSLGIDPPGRIQFSMVVEKDGSLTDIQVRKPEEEAYRSHLKEVIAKMPYWIPAQHLGEVVRSRTAYSIHIDHK